MKDNYAVIVQKNLDKLYAEVPVDLAANLPGKQADREFEFRAFGRRCVISKKGIRIPPLDLQIGNTEQVSENINTNHSFSGNTGNLNAHTSLFGILISLYALHACPDICVAEPFRGFKEFPGTMPYVGAFTTHTEHLLVPKVPEIKNRINDIKKALNGTDAPAGTGGDFAFVLYPLPKIALCYIFYEADEDFDASVTCLISNNADRFISIDGLADVGEYTSRTILEIIGS